ncbi:MAG: hypothetical protein RI996_259 [Candidatus Parcubacteria bacterium]|jgi:hypothetical protein
MNHDSRFTNQDPLVPPIEARPLPNEKQARIVRTFEDDIADAVRDGKGSVLGIALAEQKKKESSIQVFKEKKNSVLFVVLGILLLVISFLVIGVIAYQKYGTSVFPDMMRGSASFSHPSIRSDKTLPIALDTLIPKNGISKSMLYTLGGSDLSTGAVTLAIPTVVNSEGGTEMAETDAILKGLAPNAPSILGRSLATSTVLGIYSGDVADPFIVLKVNSYEGAFSGMLGWEDFMSDDLYTFFAVVLPTVVDEPERQVETTTALELFGSTGTSTAATSTIASTIVSSVPKTTQAKETLTRTPQRDITKFVDRTIKNKDMRVIESETGRIYFLYGFVDPNTIIITTSTESFFEIANRLR